MDAQPLLQELTIAERMLHSGQVQEGYNVLKRLHKHHPKHTDTMMQLAFAERLLKQWPQAIALLKKACALAPESLLYPQHLAMALMFSNTGRNTLQAIGLFAAAFQRQPDYYTGGVNMLVLSLRNDVPKPILETLAPSLHHAQPDAIHLQYACACAIAAWLVDDPRCGDFIATALASRQAAYDAAGKPLPGDLYFMLIYVEFLRDLLAFRHEHPALYAGTPTNELHIIGESHCLTPAHLMLTCGERTWRVVPHLIMGAQAYMFTLAEPDTWRYALEEIIRKLPKDAPIIVAFGELDCRPKEGIMNQYRTHADYALEPEIDRLCAQYVRCVKQAQLRRSGRCYIAGVPAPKRFVMADLSQGEAPVFVHIIRHFNLALQREATKQELGFIDIYAATANDDGWAKESVHLDHVHLRPDIVAHALTAALGA